MIQQAAGPAKKPTLLVTIGNTNTRIATWHERSVRAALAVRSGDADAFDRAFHAHLSDASVKAPAAVVVASVVPVVLEQVRDYVSKHFDLDTLVIGENLSIPMDTCVDQPGLVGVDRLCSSFAAFERLKGTCIVVDFGTAITVDLVDGDGVFQGGSILPGVSLQLRALTEHTAQLPRVQPGIPTSLVAKNTSDAMQNGVCRGAAGAVRGLVESYATSLNHWPQVVATGGDLPLLLPHCDFIDTPVENLMLLGVGLTLSTHLAAHGA